MCNITSCFQCWQSCIDSLQLFQWTKSAKVQITYTRSGLIYQRFFKMITVVFVYTVLCPKSSDSALSPDPSFTSKAAILAELGYLASDTVFYVDTATADDTSANQLQISLFCTLVLQSDVGYFFGVGSFFPLFFPECSSSSSGSASLSMSSAILKLSKIKNFVMVANLVTNGKTTCVCRNKAARSTKEKSREAASR